MTGYWLILGGALAMVFGTVMIIHWVSGKGCWLDRGVVDTRGATKSERQLLDIYFVALVLTPLLGGALAILLGLRELLA